MKRISKEPDVRRQELMDIGFELYMKNGMKGFGIKDVVNHAGVERAYFIITSSLKRILLMKF